MIAVLGDDGRTIEGWIMSDGESETPGPPRIIPLRAVDGTALDAPQRTLDELMTDSVYQLCVAHMVSGLRVANRLRAECGLPALTGDDVLTILGMQP